MTPCGGDPVPQYPAAWWGVVPPPWVGQVPRPVSPEQLRQWQLRGAQSTPGRVTLTIRGHA